MMATDEIDTDRALNLLIHDLRAPLSVAQGYIRLLSQDRLPSAEERTRALAQTMDALGRMARLCDDAAAYAAPPPRDAGVIAGIDMQRAIAQIKEACVATGADPVSFSIDAERLTGMFRGGRIDRIADAVAVILGAVRRAKKGQAVRVAVTAGAGEAQFLIGHDEDHAALLSRPPEAFDAWRGGHGIALPLACRTVTQAGGRIWTFADARGAVGIAFPGEASFS